MGRALVFKDGTWAGRNRQLRSSLVPNIFCTDTDEGTAGAAPAPDGSSDVIAVKISGWQIHAIAALQVVP